MPWQQLKDRGCDASNDFDEEVPDHLREFSDDEAEMRFCRGAKVLLFPACRSALLS